MTRTYPTKSDAYNAEVWPIVERLAEKAGVATPIIMDHAPFARSVIEGEPGAYCAAAPTVLAHEIAQHLKPDVHITPEHIWSAMGEAEAEHGRVSATEALAAVEAERKTREKARDSKLAGRDADVERALELLQTLTSSAIELASIAIRLKR